MINHTYARIITEWCAATGAHPWTQDDDLVFDMDGTAVGLLYDQAMPQWLHLYIDLGPHGADNIHRRLLEFNMVSGQSHQGYFALNPDDGHVTYRSRVHLTEDLLGADLPQQIASLVLTARAQLQQ